MSSVSHCSVPQACTYKFGVTFPNLCVINFLSCFNNHRDDFFCLQQSLLSLSNLQLVSLSADMKVHFWNESGDETQYNIVCSYLAYTLCPHYKSFSYNTVSQEQYISLIWVLYLHYLSLKILKWLACSNGDIILRVECVYSQFFSFLIFTQYFLRLLQFMNHVHWQTFSEMFTVQYFVA